MTLIESIFSVIRADQKLPVRSEQHFKIQPGVTVIDNKIITVPIITYKASRNAENIVGRTDKRIANFLYALI
jgi:hypothetical protein